MFCIRKYICSVMVSGLVKWKSGDFRKILIVLKGDCYAILEGEEYIQKTGGLRV